MNSNYDTLEPSLRQDDSTLTNFKDMDSLFNTYLGQDYDINGAFQDGQGSLENFLQGSIDQWSGEDCYDWANSICQAYRLDPADANILNFTNTTGKAIMKFDQDEFCSFTCDAYGKIFYKALRLLKKTRKGKGAKRLSNGITNGLNNGLGEHAAIASSSTYDVDSWKLSKEEFQDLDQYIPEGESWNTIPEDLYDLELADTRNDYHNDNDDEYGATASTSPGLPHPNHHPVYEGAQDAAEERVKTESRRGERKPKVYEFLMRLLSDERTNPLLIRWADINTATFILTQPAIIAQLWGARSKKDLSPNNFARALRYHYNTGGLISVSERHYMYRCGPKALKYLKDLKGTSSSSPSS